MNELSRLIRVNKHNKPDKPAKFFCHFPDVYILLFIDPTSVLLSSYQLMLKIIISELSNRIAICSYFTGTCGDDVSHSRTARCWLREIENGIKRSVGRERSLGEHPFIYLFILFRSCSFYFSNIDLNCFLDRTETKSW
jgi:hypothetical protein